MLTAPPTEQRDARPTRNCRCRKAHHLHGTRRAYLADRGRCPACTEANAAAGRAQRRRQAVQAWNGSSSWAPAVGTRRRLQALSATGWSSSQLATRLGVTRSAVATLRSTKQDRVLATTAAAVAALYEDCWWRTPPGRNRDLVRTETWAAGFAWSDPSRWTSTNFDDPTAQPARLADESPELDAAALTSNLHAGRPGRLSRSERRVVVAELSQRGASAGEIAALTGCCKRTVVRDRQRVQQGAA